MPQAHILIVEDDAELTQFLVVLLTLEGYTVSTAPDGETAIQMMSEMSYDLVLTDLYLPRADGFEVLAHLQRSRAPSGVVMVTGHGSIESAVEAMRKGALDYITKPVTPEQLNLIVKKALEVQRLQRENRFLRQQLKGKYRFENLIGTSAAMQRVFELIEKVAHVESTVLILGESGTGKELVARAIHFNGRRAEQILLPVNCGAIPEALLESELFGHERGAFTGATRSRMGRFELANGGTIFLDEVGDMSPALQVKLLRVLQEQCFDRVGGGKSVRVDVRILAATNRDLERAVARGEFREDLYYRLNVIPLSLPALRERKEDIPILLQHFLNQFNQMRHRTLEGASPYAMEILLNYPWPGNVRELENLVDRLVVLKGHGLIEPDDLPEKIRGTWKTTATRGIGEIPDGGFCLEMAMHDFERTLLTAALRKAGGVKNQAARLLGMKRSTFMDRLKHHSLPPAL
ncbi:MAG: sigma-54-dependent transcriptional regulator [Candidatus Entotheonellia bacterium]